jgi:hypothetical protein
LSKVQIKIILSLIFLFFFTINAYSWDVYQYSKNNKIELEITCEDLIGEYPEVIIKECPEWIVFSKNTADIVSDNTDNNKFIAKFSFDVTREVKAGENGVVEVVIRDRGRIWNKAIELSVRPQIIRRDFSSGNPRNAMLLQNYPNPFSSETEISYQVGYQQSSVVKLGVYTITGELVKDLVSSHQESGYYKVKWDGRDWQGREVPTGIYVYKMSIGKFTQVKKTIKIK